jgi:hypothetical protein
MQDSSPCLQKEGVTAYTARAQRACKGADCVHISVVVSCPRIVSVVATNHYPLNTAVQPSPLQCSTECLETSELELTVRGALKRT